MIACTIFFPTFREALDNNEGGDDDIIKISNEDIENYDLKTNLEDNVTNMTENLEDSGNCSNTSDDNDYDDMEVTNEFENLIARATELITSSSTLSPLDKVKDNALENDFIMD